ncbi:MAG TPA: PAS sensor protein [Candidatus Coprenecus stercoravium]|uniref:PAS sensor protein n=1 Tax=Candidatus Coprenecus stercoravium TaxID=2840735 RepID=A0A9D2KAN7_9BACT|nr:PAS sensor protein [Candidatus Coprenecus stercoravium]
MIGDFFKETGCAVTVCDTDCNIVYQNDMSVAVNGDMRGKCMLPCHNDRSRGIIGRILSEGITNSYTISKKGQRKLIHQTPWYRDGRIAGIIELSIVIPDQMPHYDRS